MSISTSTKYLLKHILSCAWFFNDVFNIGITYCNATYDNYLCWQPVPAGEIISQNCPPDRMSNTRHLAFRRCGPNGIWIGRDENEMDHKGWTNYTPCFPTAAQKLLTQLGKEEWQVATNTRYMEIVGFSISLIALAVSFCIFSRFRTLRNHRTRIHKSLFGAMLMQVVIRLTIYLDQAIVRNVVEGHWYLGIESMPYLCESLYTLLEYAITVMFMWMFIEGMYLHNVVTANALRTKVSFPVYYAIGWGLPVIVTGIWATLTSLNASEESTCWYGYNFGNLYWILQGPRIAVVAANFLFLHNILRDLIAKLRGSENNDLQVIKKAVRAALVLLPLLGLTNSLNMIEPPLDGIMWKFILWSYSTHFLRSFQGFFLALIYCFLNHEVRTVIRKRHNDWMAIREDNARRHRESSFFRSTAFSTDNRLPYSSDFRSEIELHNRPQWIEMKAATWSRRSSSVESPTPPPRKESLPILGPPKFEQRKPEPEPTRLSSIAIIEETQDELDDDVFLPAGMEQYCDCKDHSKASSSYDTVEPNGYSTDATNGYESFEPNHGVSPYDPSMLSLQFNFDVAQ